jgi:hypothetical protein
MVAWSASATCLLTCLLACGQVRAQVVLDKLTACDDLAQLQATLRVMVDQAPRRCRAPSGALERTLFARLPDALESSCLLREAPVPSLSGFSCLVSRTPPAAELICFRPTRAGDLRAYKHDPDGAHRRASVAYRKDAAKCGVSTGDTGPLHMSTFPFRLMTIAEMEFGDIDALRGEARGGSYAIHAFSRTDPKLPGLPPAIESVSMLVGGVMPKSLSPDNRHRISSWIVTVDEDDELDRQLNDPLRRVWPFKLESKEFGLSRALDNAGPDKDRVRQVFRKLHRGFLAEGFKELHDDDFIQASGKNLSEILKKMDEASPYGARKLYPIAERIGPMAFMLNTKRPTCTEGGRGALMAFVVSSLPDPDELSDYGSISVMLVGGGDCAQFTGATDRYVKGLMEDATKRVIESLD